MKLFHPFIPFLNCDRNKWHFLCESPEEKPLRKIREKNVVQLHVLNLKEVTKKYNKTWSDFKWRTRDSSKLKVVSWTILFHFFFNSHSISVFYLWNVSCSVPTFAHFSICTYLRLTREKKNEEKYLWNLMSFQIYLREDVPTHQNDSHCVTWNTTFSL